jgi:hypothetical protein
MWMIMITDPQKIFDMLNQALNQALKANSPRNAESDGMAALLSKFVMGDSDAEKSAIFVEILKFYQEMHRPLETHLRKAFYEIFETPEGKANNIPTTALFEFSTFSPSLSTYEVEENRHAILMEQIQEVVDLKGKRKAEIAESKTELFSPLVDLVNDYVEYDNLLQTPPDIKVERKRNP